MCKFHIVSRLLLCRLVIGFLKYVSLLSFCSLAKTILVLPMLFLFALFALGIPLYAIQDAPKESFGIMIVMFAVIMFVFESLAECLSVWSEDPIMGKILFVV